MKTQFKAMLLMLSLIFMGAPDSFSKPSSAYNTNNDLTFKYDTKSLQSLIDKYEVQGWSETDYAKAMDIIEEECSEDTFDKYDYALSKAVTDEEVENILRRQNERYELVNTLISIFYNSFEDDMGETTYQRWLSIIPVDEDDVESMLMTEIEIVDFPYEDKEVKAIDPINENYAEIGNIDIDVYPDIVAVQNATKDIVAPPEPINNNQQSSSKKSDTEKIFEAVEQLAQFPGGQGELNSWLAQNLRYPEQAQNNNIEGKVIVQFVIEKDGTITNPVIARGVDKDLDKEAIRIVKKMPKWSPGRNNGVPVRSKYTLPVVFKLQH